jgi:hypothetical protein
MESLYHPLVILHLTSAIVWVGAVFMGTFVDWPVIRTATTNGRFPFDFIIGQGVKVGPAVYVGIISQLISATGLAIIKPPQTWQDAAMLGVKGLCLAWMAGSTIYGTLRTWPKLIFAIDEDAFRLYKVYMVRASITFACGIVAAVIGHFYR